MSDDDFAGYVGARWPSLVRTLVLLGCPLDEAPDVVTTGLARCRRGWREATEHDDLEVVVHRAVLDAWTARRREHWWVGLRARTGAEWPLPDLSTLDRLTPEVRAGLVLRRFAGLDPAQAVAVAGREAGGPLPVGPDAPTLVSLADGIVVLAAPDESRLARARPPGRRRRWVIGAAALAVVAALVTWTALTDDDGPAHERADVLKQVVPQRQVDPAGVAWYAEGVLHLAGATYAIDGIRQVGVLSLGAVYGDDHGRVVLLDADGTRTLIGTKDPGSPLVSSDDDALVAWVDADGSQLVAYDVAQDHVVGHLRLPPGATDGSDTRAVAIDNGHVYYMSANGWGQWRPGDPEPEVTGSQDLYDASSANLLFQIDERDVGMKQPFFDVTRAVPGRGGSLSLDGKYAVTRSPDDGSVLVYAFDSGARVDVAPPDGVNVVDVALEPAGAITYLTVVPDAFASQEGSDSLPGKGELVTCALKTGECQTLATFVVQNEAPILAR